MGTRHLITVKLDGKYKIAQYGQWDGYPDGQGISILTFLRGANMDVFKGAVAECSYMTLEERKSTYTNMGIFADEYGGIPCSEAERHDKQFPEISRDTGAEILSLVLLNGKRNLYDNLDFAADSLFCEWAYVIDFDKNTFEVYKGFNNVPLSETEPFYFLQEQGKHIKESRGRDQYYPVKLKALWPLDKLPSDDEFISTFTCEIDDEIE